MIKHSFVLSKNSAGFDSTEDHWQPVISQHLKIWATVVTLLKNSEIQHGGREIQIEIDWQPAVKSCQQFGSVMEEIERFRDRDAPPPMDVLRNFPGQTEVAIEVQSTERIIAGGHFHPVLYVENRLADVFLMMNIAEPGCCDFYSANLLEQRAGELKLNKTKISLSSILFEIAQVDTLDGRWPGVSPISLETVVKWFENIRTGVRQIPQTI